MKLTQRLKTLWNLSELEVTKNDNQIHIDYKSTILPEKTRMAQIIKRKTDEDIIKELLKEE